jgi:hypothetical protein
VSKWLSVVPLKDSIADAGEKLRFQAVFEPQKPFAATVELAVVHPSRGRCGALNITIIIIIIIITMTIRRSAQYPPVSSSILVS